VRVHVLWIERLPFFLMRAFPFQPQNPPGVGARFLQCRHTLSGFFHALRPSSRSVFHGLMAGPNQVLRFLHRIFRVTQRQLRFTRTVTFQGPDVQESVDQSLKRQSQHKALFAHEAAEDGVLLRRDIEQDPKNRGFHSGTPACAKMAIA